LEKLNRKKEGRGRGRRLAIITTRSLECSGCRKFGGDIVDHPPTPTGESGGRSNWPTNKGKKTVMRGPKRFLLWRIRETRPRLGGKKTGGRVKIPKEKHICGNGVYLERKLPGQRQVRLRECFPGKFKDWFSPGGERDRNITKGMGEIKFKMTTKGRKTLISQQNPEHQREKGV